MPYYYLKNKFTNKYAVVDKELDGSYGHTWKPTSPVEHVNFDGIVFENKSECIHDSWCNDDVNGEYNPLIAKTMRHHRFLDIRRLQKLNDIATEFPRSDERHDPCAKYRLVWDVMEHNMNVLMAKGGLDLTIDETTWSNMGFGGLALWPMMHMSPTRHDMSPMSPICRDTSHVSRSATCAT